MHQPIRDFLEEYLSDPEDRTIPDTFQAHMASCSACAREVLDIKAQSRLLTALRAPADVEPAPGFYAKVMNRVEEQTVDTFWTPFLEPMFGKSLALACGALVLVLGTYLLGSEPIRHQDSPTGVVVSSVSNPSEDGAVLPHQRDAVLVNLVSFQE